MEKDSASSAVSVASPSYTTKVSSAVAEAAKGPAAGAAIFFWSAVFAFISTLSLLPSSTAMSSTAYSATFTVSAFCISCTAAFCASRIPSIPFMPPAATTTITAAAIMPHCLYTGAFFFLTGKGTTLGAASTCSFCIRLAWNPSGSSSSGMFCRESMISFCSSSSSLQAAQFFRCSSIFTASSAVVSFSRYAQSISFTVSQFMVFPPFFPYDEAIFRFVPLFLKFLFLIDFLHGRYGFLPFPVIIPVFLQFLHKKALLHP